MSNPPADDVTRLRPGCWAAALLIAAGLPGAIGSSQAAEPGPLPITPDTLSAVLNSDSYGYDVACIINGHDVGIVGGRSEGMRQFDEATREGSTDPSDRSTYSTLHIGRNSIRITYRRRVPREPFDLNITLQVFGYKAPLFYAHVTDGDQGSFEGTFDIDPVPAKTFRPVYFTNEDPARSGFLFADQAAPATGSYTASLNGGREHGEFGRPSLPAPLHGFHAGANQLAVTYVTKGGPIRLVVVGPVGMSSYVLESAKEAHRTFVIQGSTVTRHPANTPAASPRPH